MTFLAKTAYLSDDAIAKDILAIPQTGFKANPHTGRVWKPVGITWHNTGNPGLGLWAQYSAAQRAAWGDNLNAMYRRMGWHCFGGEVEFCTRDGIRTFAECAGRTVDVLTPSGYVSAPVKRFGRQDLYRARLVQVTRRVSGGLTWYSPSASTPIEIRVTRDHAWPLANGRLTRELMVGDVVADGRYCPDEDSADFAAGMRHGFVYGDGWKERGRFLAGVHGRKKTILAYFADTECRFFPSRAARESTYVCTLSIQSDRDLKILPDSGDNPDYLSGFVRGWIVADGSVKRGETYKLASAPRKPLEWLIDIAPYAGASVSASKNIVENAHSEGAYKQGFYYTVDVRLNDRPWRVESFEFDRGDDVYCAVLPNEDKLFTLANGILTHNSGPHGCGTPSGYAIQLCDWQADGVHASCFNEDHFGFETVGNFCTGGDDPTVGAGQESMKSTANMIAAICLRFGFDPDRNINWHHDCTDDHHACPGNRVLGTPTISLVKARMVELSKTHTYVADPLGNPVLVQRQVLDTATAVQAQTITTRPATPVSIPAWPPAGNPLWTRAAEVVIALRGKGAQNPLVIAALANAYAESAVKPLPPGGDGGKASNMWQWWPDRAARILAGCGIDVRSEINIARVVDALWWELENVYPKALAKLKACNFSDTATRVFCEEFEGAGAENAWQRRVAEGAWLDVWVAQNEAFIEGVRATLPLS